MRKNILMLLTGCLAAMTVSASNIHHNTDSIYKQNTFSRGADALAYESYISEECKRSSQLG